MSRRGAGRRGRRALRSSNVVYYRIRAQYCAKCARVTPPLVTTLRYSIFYLILSQSVDLRKKLCVHSQVENFSQHHNKSKTLFPVTLLRTSFARGALRLQPPPLPTRISGKNVAHLSNARVSPRRPVVHSSLSSHMRQRRNDNNS